MYSIAGHLEACKISHGPGPSGRLRAGARPKKSLGLATLPHQQNNKDLT